MIIHIDREIQIYDWIFRKDETVIGIYNIYKYKHEHKEGNKDIERDIKGCKKR